MTFISKHKYSLAGLLTLAFCLWSQPELNAQNQICAGEDVTIVLSNPRGGIQWQQAPLPTGPYSNLTGETGDTLTITPTGDIVYRACFVIEEGCDTLYSDTISFDVNDLMADAGTDLTHCEGDSVSIGGNPSASGGTSPYVYNWAPAVGLSSATVSNPDVTAGPGDYAYILTVTDADNCTATDTVAVTVDPVTHDSTVFLATGAVQLFIVPPCTDSLFIELWGAKGSNGGAGNGGTGGQGGAGNFVEGELAVSPGDTIWVYVGDTTGFPNGGSGGSGAFDGGNGGGASDVRYMMNVTDSIKGLASGGGGGGAGGSGNWTTNSPGGFAGEAGLIMGAGGGDGSYVGGTSGTGGGGGDQVNGGAAGMGHTSLCAVGINGLAGAAYSGGDGGDGSQGGCSTIGSGGGGGGGGYRGGGGGGGGGGEQGASTSGGGGGGGSSYIAGLLNPFATQFGMNNGNGKVVIHW